MTADIYEKAHSLASAMAASQELLTLRQTEKDMLEDEEAQKIINDFQDTQHKLSEYTDESEIPQELRLRVSEIEERLESNPVISKYLEAQDRFTEMLDQINSILASAIAGNSEAPDSGCAGCGGGCSPDGCF